MSNLVSLQIEKHCIAGLIQNQNAFAEVEGFLNERDFCAKPHDVIYSCLKSSLLNNEKVDKVLLAQKIKNLGISFKDDINIFDYIDAITFTPITYAATIGYAKELVKLRILRNIDSVCDNIKLHVSKNVNQDLDKTITEVDAIYGETVKELISTSGVDNIFEDMYEAIEATGNNPITEIGLSSPFPEFNRLFGGFRPKNAYLFISRPKQGKSTFLSYLAAKMSEQHGIPILIADTEMSSSEVKFRTAASITKIPLWALESGSWRKNESYIKTVRDEDFKNIKNKYRVYHISVGNMPVERVCSLVRRWHMQYVGKSEKSAFIYDYIKLTGEKLSNNWGEHQALGSKLDMFKKLSEELDFPFISAGQMNRSGENIGRNSQDISDDGSVIAASDRLSWFASFVSILRTKGPDELLLDGPESGSHKIIPLFLRHQGRDAQGFQDWIQRTFPDGTKKYIRNFVNYKIENFNVSECGSAKDSIARQNSQFLLTTPPNPHDHHQQPL